MKRILCLTALAMFAVGAGSGGAAAQEDAQKGWFKVCSKQEKNDICNVQNIVAADTGQLLTAVNIIEIKGDVNRRIFQIAVPTGRLIPPGVAMSIDGGAARKIDYAVCLPDRCIAEAPLDDALISSLKGGGELTLTSVNFQRAQNPIKMSLKGFTSAFDGEPIEQSELQERQKKLQEEMEKKAQAAREKLDAAQEQAKQAN